MVVTFDMQWLCAVILVAARLGALLFASPLLSLAQMPGRVKLLFVVIMSVAATSIISHDNLGRIVSEIELAIAIAREVAVGVLMSFSVACAFASFSFAGRVLDLQMGFGVANLVNPQTNEQAPLIGTALSMVAVMTFYLIGGHHWVVQGFLQSYQWFPLGAPLAAISLNAIVGQFGLMFSLGLMLVAPVVAVLLLIDLAMAFSARTMPQMNVFLLSIPRVGR